MSAVNKLWSVAYSNWDGNTVTVIRGRPRDSNRAVIIFDLDNDNDLALLNYLVMSLKENGYV